MFRNKGYVIGIIVFVVVAILVFTLLELYADVAWFQMLGVTSVLWTRLAARWLLFLGAWAVAAVVSTSSISTRCESSISGTTFGTTKKAPATLRCRSLGASRA